MPDPLVLSVEPEGVRKVYALHRFCQGPLLRDGQKQVNVLVISTQW
jgi:hypothetical protein